MKILIAEDDLASRKVMEKLLSDYGKCDLTSDGMEAVEAFIIALDSGELYDLICLDVMMPKVDGIRAMKTIRQLEKERCIEPSKMAKIIITTALANVSYISSSLETNLDAYIGKPIDLEELKSVMKRIGLL